MNKSEQLIEAFNPYAWMKQTVISESTIPHDPSADWIEKAFRKLEDKIIDNESDFKRIYDAYRDEGIDFIGERGRNIVKRIEKESLRDQNLLSNIRILAKNRVAFDKKTGDFSVSQLEILADMAGTYGRNTAKRLIVLARNARKMIDKF